MKLRNKYAVGVHITFYEIKMIQEYIDSCIQALNEVENKENVYFHFCFNISEYFEDIDTKVISISDIKQQFNNEIQRLIDVYKDHDYYTSKNNIIVETKDNNDSLYNIASYRRDLNYNWCDKVDFVLWGETDSLWPKETFTTIEMVNEYSESQNINRYVLTFAYRKMWDTSWDPLTHVDFEQCEFIDTDEWSLNALESPKSYMTLQQMNELNAKSEELDIRILNKPKFDGSCLVISSDLIKAGVNIPHSLLCCGEDTSFADMAKLIMGDTYVQFVIKNILRVHNRRHPQKRLYVKNENNPRGFCGNAKGNWWKTLEGMSKSNLSKLRYNQDTFFTFKDVLNSK